MGSDCQNPIFFIARPVQSGARRQKEQWRENAGWNASQRGRLSAWNSLKLLSLLPLRLPNYQLFGVSSI